MSRRVWRVPLVAAALLSLVCGVWLGLLRLGWVLPLPNPDQLILHGPLMIGGFLGTVIGLERAIGFGRPWAYAAPTCTAVGALMLICGAPTPMGAAFITVGSAIVTVVFVRILQAHVTLFAATMLSGAAAWLIGNALWSAGFAVYRVVFWWIAFIVVTIAGERLELNRLLQPTRAIRAAFVACVVVIFGGAAAIARRPELGVRVTGLGLLTLCAWLAVNDIARRTIRQQGLTRFIAVSLLSGYVWLGVGGVVAMITGAFEPGPIHDAILNAVFLGFVVSMIFGHAPIVFPAITGRAMHFHRGFYVPLVLLHASVVLRLVGDLVEDVGSYRAWGGLLNAFALLAFVLNTAATATTLRFQRAGPASRQQA